jgi:hypothetical protein
MKRLIQIGKPTPIPIVRDVFQQLTQREADEIKRLKQAMSARSQH